MDNNNPKYLKDVNKLQSVIDEINKSHFNNLKFMNPQLDAPNFISTHLNNNNCSPDIAEYINECITNSKEIQKFYLSSIASYREYDLYENQGLREFEIGNEYYDIFIDSEVWEKPTNSEIKLEWINETTKWDENLIDSLILISEKHKKEIYLKVSFDYPVVENFYNYHILWNTSNKIKNNIMKNSPLYIIYTQACKYLSEHEVKELSDKISKGTDRHGKIFLRIFLKNFDIEVFKNKPLIPEDIWLYNYIKYEITKKSIPRSGLIKLYEKTFFWFILEQLYLFSSDKVRKYLLFSFISSQYFNYKCFFCFKMVKRLYVNYHLALKQQLSILDKHELNHKN